MKCNIKKIQINFSIVEVFDLYALEILEAEAQCHFKFTTPQFMQSLIFQFTYSHRHSFPFVTKPFNLRKTIFERLI